MARSFQRLFHRDVPTRWTAVRDSEATHDKISLESFDLVLVPEPDCFCYFHYDMLLPDIFTYLLFSIYYRVGALLSTFRHGFIQCSGRCSQVGYYL